MFERIQEAIEDVENAEKLNEVSNVKKKLKGDADYYRIRVGDYRIGIKVNDGIVCLVRILHRKEIYRYFPQSFQPSPHPHQLKLKLIFNYCQVGSASN